MIGTCKKINRAVWGIAGGVMAYGAINVTALLISHGVHLVVAPLLSLMVDLAMCVGLLSDRVLHQYGRRDGWVTALRWVTAGMTLLLNIAQPCLEGDLVGVGIHAFGPLLLLVVAEAAGSIQRQMTEIIRELRASQAGDVADGKLRSGAVSTVGFEPPGSQGEKGNVQQVAKRELDQREVVDGETRGHENVVSPALAGDGAGAERSRLLGGAPLGKPSASEAGAVDVGTASMADARAVPLPASRQFGDLGVDVMPTVLALAKGSASSAVRPAHGLDDALPAAVPGHPIPKAEGASRSGQADGSWAGGLRDASGKGSEPEASVRANETRDTATGHCDERSREGERATRPEGPRVGGRSETAKQVMWQHWSRCRQAGTTPSGIELDERAGTSNYGRAVLREWLATQRITNDEFAQAQAAARHRRRTGIQSVDNEPAAAA